MPPILIAQPTSITDNQWLHVNLQGTQEGGKARDLVVVSGIAFYAEGTLIGHADHDGWVVPYVVQMDIGPLWRKVVDVSPTITPSGYIFMDSDTADHSGFHVLSTTWSITTVPGFKRIRLEAELSIRGGPGFSLQQLTFHLVAKGTLAPNQNFNEIT